MQGLEQLLEGEPCISAILCRENCFQYGNYVLKDLSLIQRKIEEIIIVDDNFMVWPRNLDNIIPIKTFTGDTKDSHLKDILQFLGQISHATDVRLPLKNKYQLQMRAQRFAASMGISLEE